MQVAGIGRVLFWEGGSLWLGLVTGIVELHAHHAIQISLPIDGAVQFRGAPDTDWVAYFGAVIPPRQLHAYRAPGTVAATVLFEPESAAGRAILGMIGAHGITALSKPDAARLIAPLASAYRDAEGDDSLVAAARQIIARISGLDARGPATDRRVLAAIAHIRDHIDEAISLPDLARHVGLSPGRFRHLFVRETGVSCKAFVLWERLNKALALGFGGMSWTEAAHAANFADSAHLSRTCRRMFGLSPTGARIERPKHGRRLSA